MCWKRVPDDWNCDVKTASAELSLGPSITSISCRLAISVNFRAGGALGYMLPVKLLRRVPQSWPLINFA